MKFYESKRNYKLLMIIPVAFMLFSVGVLANHYMQTGEWFSRSIELRGGTLVTVKTAGPADAASIEAMLSGFEEVSVSTFSSLAGSGFQIKTDANANATLMFSTLKAGGIDVSDYSVATFGPELSASFWSQAQLAILFAFIVMGTVVFFFFRNMATSITIIICAFLDIVETFAFMQIFGIDLSLAGLAATLMLIGYSVDTDIVLNMNMLKDSGKGSMTERTSAATKTGLTMTFTTIGALAALLISGLSPVLSQIASIMLIGMSLDIMNTWIQNYGMIRWYMERKGIQ